MFRFRGIVGPALAAALLAAPAFAVADCKLLLVAEFKLDPKRATPVVDGSINGHPVKVALDTGSDFSMIKPFEAQKLGLSTVEAIAQRAYGIGGDTQISWTHVNELRIGDLTKTSIDVAVAGDRHMDSDVEAVIGDDVLSKADLEFDLAHNAVRMFRPQGCSPPQLVYWGAAYSQAALLPWGRDTAAIQAEAYLNGKRILAEIDSANETSLVSAEAADADGVTRSAEDPPVGPIHGVGPKPEASWIGRFDSFALGDEKVAHVRIQVVHVWWNVLLLGDDFLRAHRVFVDNEDHLILFSYQGGPVFGAAAAPADAR
jgi:hypothetical protein